MSWFSFLTYLWKGFLVLYDKVLKLINSNFLICRRIWRTEIIAAHEKILWSSRLGAMLYDHLNNQDMSKTTEFTSSERDQTTSSVLHQCCPLAQQECQHVRRYSILCQKQVGKPYTNWSVLGDHFNTRLWTQRMTCRNWEDFNTLQTIARTGSVFTHYAYFISGEQMVLITITIKSFWSCDDEIDGFDIFYHCCRIMKTILSCCGIKEHIPLQVNFRALPDKGTLPFCKAQFSKNLTF